MFLWWCGYVFVVVWLCFCGGAWCFAVFCVSVVAWLCF